MQKPTRLIVVSCLTKLILEFFIRIPTMAPGTREVKDKKLRQMTIPLRRKW